MKKYLLPTLIFSLCISACTTTPWVLPQGQFTQASVNLQPASCPTGTQLNLQEQAQTCLLPDGTPHGPFRLLSPTGQIERAGFYDHKTPVGTWHAFRNGTLTWTKTFNAKGQLHGPMQSWDADGQALTDLIYEEGKPWRGTIQIPGPNKEPITYHYKDGRRTTP